MKHSICSVEFSATDLERAAQFYQAVLGWSFSAAADSLLFRSPDGLSGVIRQSDSLTPRLLPLLRVEVDDYAPLLDAAARLNGGYTGFVDPIGGDWTINLRDPDGNLIRLARTSSAATAPYLDAARDSDAVVVDHSTTGRLPGAAASGKPARAASGKPVREPVPPFNKPNGRSTTNGHEHTTHE